MSENKSVPFSFKKEGIYYFVRRVPKDLEGLYLTRKISYSLRTKSVRVARSRSLLEAAKLDAYWYQQRLNQAPVCTRYLSQQHIAPSVGTSLGKQKHRISVKEAISIYVRLKGKGKSKIALRAVERSMGYVIAACGTKYLDQYTKVDAIDFRDALLDRGLTGSSIARTFGAVRSVFNLAISESGLDISNPFSGVYFDRQAGVVARTPIPVDDIRRVQQKCNKIDDDIRWLVALISDTGMRLSEAVGLHMDDLILEEEQIPFVRVMEHPWRPLKTKNSVRDIPLVGAALWASERLLKCPVNDQYAFPRYVQNGSTNANSASAASNKWLKGFVPKGCSMHGFRHSLRDRLRAVECPIEIIDQIGGWSKRSIGEGYGLGYSLPVLSKWMDKAVSR